MNTQIVTRPTVAVKPVVEFVVAADVDYATGKRMYWQGYSDGCCTSRAMTEGWYDACAEDDHGRAAYFQAMQMAEADGEHVNWRNVHDICDVQYNAYGDVVRSA